MKTLLALAFVHFVLCADTTDGIVKETIYLPEDCNLKVATGDTVKTHYRGTFEDGREFDNSYDRGHAFEFQVGRGQVIPGFDHGVLNACLGEKFRLKVPHSHAYGDKGMEGYIPPKSNLIFEMHIVGINEKLLSQQQDL